MSAQTSCEEKSKSSRTQIVGLTEEDHLIFRRRMGVQAQARLHHADRGDLAYACHLEEVRSLVHDPHLVRHLISQTVSSRVHLEHAAVERDPLATESVY